MALEVNWISTVYFYLVETQPDSQLNLSSHVSQQSRQRYIRLHWHLGWLRTHYEIANFVKQNNVVDWTFLIFHRTIVACFLT